MTVNVNSIKTIRPVYIAMCIRVSRILWRLTTLTTNIVSKYYYIDLWREL